MRAAAATVFEDPDSLLRGWEEAGSSVARFPDNTGLAPSGGFNPDAIETIATLVTTAWDAARAWWDAHGGGVEEHAIADLLVAAIVAKLSKVSPQNRVDNEPSSQGKDPMGGLDGDEVEALATEIKNEVSRRIIGRLKSSQDWL
jgi:hypothetical protein